MASVIAGKIAPIDHGDGAGMNLMDYETKLHLTLEGTAPRLKSKLHHLAESSRVIVTSVLFRKEVWRQPCRTSAGLVW